jgi:predicted O-methyltransferase YrrM
LVHQLRLAYKYFIFRFKALKLHGVHSPFVFDLYNQVICHDGRYHAYKPVEDLRLHLLQNNSKIAITDFGAGSKRSGRKERKIKDLAQVAAKPAKFGQLLFRLANYFRSATIFDIGTSLGITTAYLAKASSAATVYTFEGCPETAKAAAANFKSLDLHHVKQVIGNLDDTLAPALSETDHLDLVFFDGNHRYEPTMRYFRQCLEKKTENSLFIFDDIYWSAEMEQAWKEIKDHPEVTLTIDLFWIGLVFFRKKQAKEHFYISY